MSPTVIEKFVEHIIHQIDAKQDNKGGLTPKLKAGGGIVRSDKKGTFANNLAATYII